MAAISSVGSGFITGSVIGSITAISFGGVQATEIDVTSIVSTFKEYVMGTIDGGTVDISVNLNAGALASMPTAGANTPTVFNLRLGAYSGTPSLNSPALGFSAFIQKSSFDVGVDKQVTASYTLRISSLVTIALAAS